MMGSGDHLALQTQFCLRRSCGRSFQSARPEQTQGVRLCGMELRRILQGTFGLHGRERLRCLLRRLRWISWGLLLAVMLEAAPVNFLRVAVVMEVVPTHPPRLLSRLCGLQMVHRAKEL
mmetsp:Transcript_45139/g.97974  ORF Transcript_45139/g.97974 Transcript_45139/m.97974 type:complete len:119 (+) Transcript_45139:187-543(+)